MFRFSVGLQDIVFENNTGGLSLDPKELSFFGVISSEKAMGNYNHKYVYRFWFRGLLEQ